MSKTEYLYANISELIPLISIWENIVYFAKRLTWPATFDRISTKYMYKKYIFTLIRKRSTMFIELDMLGNLGVK